MSVATRGNYEHQVALLEQTVTSYQCAKNPNEQLDAYQKSLSQIYTVLTGIHEQLPTDTPWCSTLIATIEKVKRFLEDSALSATEGLNPGEVTPPALSSFTQALRGALDGEVGTANSPSSSLKPGADTPEKHRHLTDSLRDAMGFQRKHGSPLKFPSLDNDE